MTEVSEVKGVNEAKEVKENGPASHPSIALSIHPFYSLLFPFLPFKPLASGACETSDP